jgi:hypothetical protein
LGVGYFIKESGGNKLCFPGVGVSRRSFQKEFPEGVSRRSFQKEFPGRLYKR